MNERLDELTNEFTLGAIIFDLLSDLDENNIRERYKKGVFIPNSINSFILDEKTYKCLLKATSYDRNNRYKSIKEFHQEWNLERGN